MNDKYSHFMRGASHATDVRKLARARAHARTRAHARARAQSYKCTCT